MSMKINRFSDRNKIADKNYESFALENYTEKEIKRYVANVHTFVSYRFLIVVRLKHKKCPEILSIDTEQNHTYSFGWILNDCYTTLRFLSMDFEK